MPNHHDVLFRDTFSDAEAARWLVHVALPHVPVTELRLVESSIATGGRLRQPDLIWQVDPSLRIRTAWQHQSTVDPTMDLRVLHDTAVLLRGWVEQQLDPLPALLTVVVTHAPRAWNTPRDVRERMARLPAHLEPDVVRCPYTVLDLADVAEDVLRTAPPITQLTLRLLRAVQRHGPKGVLWDTFLEQGSLITETISRNGLSAIERFVRYLLRTAPPRPKEPIMAQLSALDPQLPEKFVSWADQLHAEGREEGRQEGREEGREEGRAEGEAKGRAEGERAAALALLLRLGERRFGPPTPAQRQALTLLDRPKLDDLALRILDASGWEDLLG